ncbi:MAG: PilZ domain-containing protein [Deltaproteobacteria bacterium]|nr:PilZ domain-containing protein [Deltaproteobacteria bacterium]
MFEKLENIYELRMLVAMKQLLGISLNSKEEKRLSSLKKLLTMKVPRFDENDTKTALETPLFTQYTTAGGFGSGLIRNLSGGGMAILTYDPPPLGQRLIVHVTEQRHGIEYIFPCFVLSRVLKGNTSISVAFEGTPSQVRVGGQGSGVWQKDGGNEGSSEQPSRKSKSA